MFFRKTIFFIVLLLLIHSASSQQSHPLSQVYPIDTDLEMNSYSIKNANWVNTTSINAGLICLGGSCQSSWASSGWLVSGSYIYNSTSGVRVGIGTSMPSQELEVAGNILAQGSLLSNELLINGGFAGSGLTIDQYGNILTKGNLTYSGYTYIIDTLRFNGTAEAPFGVKGGYIYPGSCNGLSCMQGNYYLYVDSNLIKSNTGLEAVQLFDNGNRVLTSVSAGSGLISSGTAPAITLSLNYGDNFIGWKNLTDYPSPCPAGQFVTAIGDTLTCQAPTASSSGWSMSGDALYNDTPSVKVGIGTSNPTSKFHIQWSDTNCGSQCFSDAANI